MHQLYKTTDEALIDLFWRREESAIAQTDEKYGPYLHTVARNMMSDRRDQEECVNDTYLGVWNSIPPARPNGFKAFLTTVLRRVCINRYHSNRRKKEIPSELTLSLGELEPILTDGRDAEAAFDAKNLGRVISDFVAGLSQRRQYIFMRRYYLAVPIGQIAGELGLSRSMVNKELAAIRLSLKEKLEKEGYVYE